MTGARDGLIQAITNADRVLWKEVVVPTFKGVHFHFIVDLAITQCDPTRHQLS